MDGGHSGLTASDPPTTAAPGIELGDAFVHAVVARDFDGIEALLAPDVRFRALVPSAIREATTSAGARRWIEAWFGDVDQSRLVDSRAEMVADRLHLGYRLEVHEDGTWRLVEQQLFATVARGRLADVALVCSGFRPFVVTSTEPGLPDVAAGPVPRVDARLDAIGRSCATLTPEIRAAVRGLEAGQVLEILTDDPTAEDGLRAWARLTGHELLAVVPASDAGEFLYVRRAADVPRTGGQP